MTISKKFKWPDGINSAQKAIDLEIEMVKFDMQLSMA